MASGEGLVVKGGDPEYRRECAQFRAGFARSEPGVWMTDETKMAYGWGAYANVPYSYASVEMYVCLAGALRRRRGGH